MKPSNLSGHQKTTHTREQERSVQHENRADMLMIPTHIKDFIHQIPHRICVQNVSTKKIPLKCEKLHIIKAVPAIFELFE